MLNLAMQSLWWMQPLLASSANWEGKGWLLPFSTVIRRTVGEDCSSENSPAELGCSLAEWALSVKAVKLEKETPRYLESRVSVRSWWRCSIFWRRLQSAFLKNQNLWTRRSLWRRSSKGEACCFSLVAILFTN
uniref:Secreted protein n=1 Tax=Piliocolobus tephrosceles TaxID=591936 RepID=A0A8C9LKL2_9PRIM